MANAFVRDMPSFISSHIAEHKQVLSPSESALVSCLRPAVLIVVMDLVIHAVLHDAQV